MSCIATTLHTLHQGLRSVDVSGLDEGALRVATAELRNTERALAAVKLRIGQRANELAASGTGADACSTLLGTGGVSAGTARREAARSDVADTMPTLGKALADGRIAEEHLDAVARVTKKLDDQTQAALQASQAELADDASRMPVDTFNRYLARRIDQIRNDHGLERANQQRAQSELRHWIDKAGLGHIQATLDPERHAAATNAIERQLAAIANESGKPVSKDPKLAADAFVELISHGNGRQGRAHIELVVDANTALNGPHSNSIRQTVNGTDLPPETIDRFACDAVIRKVVLDERGVPIKVGRSARTATDGQWSALKAIYSSCGWHGCDRPVSWCQAHHIREWNHGGLTDLDNLVPLCNQHHHAVHEGKWKIELLPDRTLRIRRPDGQVWADAEPDRVPGTPTARDIDPITDSHPRGRRRRTGHNQ